MVGGLGNLGQLLARLAAHAHAGLLALADDAGQTRILPLPGHNHMIEFALSCAQGLLNGVQPEKNIHRP